MKTGNHIEESSFRDKLKNYSAEPPEAVWEGISTGLHGGSRRRNIYLLAGVAASVALAVTIGLGVLGPAGQPGSEPVADNELVPQSPAAEDAPRAEQPVTGYEMKEMPVQSAEKRTRMEQRVISAMNEAAPAVERMALNDQQPAVAEVSKTEGLQETTVATTDEFFIDDEPDVPYQVTTDSSPEETASQGEGETEGQEPSFTDLDPYADSSFITQEENKRRNIWQVGAAISPQYTYRDAASPDVSQNQVVDRNETGMLAYAGGIRVSFVPSGRFSIESGVYFNKMGLNIGSYDSYYGRLNAEYDFVPVENRNIVTIANSIGNIDPEGDEVYYNKYTMQSESQAFRPIESAIMTFNGEEVTTITQTFSYLEIPLNLRYKVIDSRVDVLLTGGVSTNVLVGNAVIGNTVSESVKIGKVEDVRTLNYSGNAGVGIAYDIFEQLVFTVEPRFRYYLNSVNNPFLPSTRPYSFGLFTGVQYSF